MKGLWILCLLDQLPARACHRRVPPDSHRIATLGAAARSGDNPVAKFGVPPEPGENPVANWSFKSKIFFGQSPKWNATAQEPEDSCAYSFHSGARFLKSSNRPQIGVDRQIFWCESEMKCHRTSTGWRLCIFISFRTWTKKNLAIDLQCGAIWWPFAH